MMFKKGLNNVVANVLLIAVVLAVVLIIWLATKYFFVGSGEESKIKIALVSTEFEIIEAKVNEGELKRNATLIVQRKAGGGVVNGVVIVLKDRLGNSESFEIEGVFNELERKNLFVDFSDSSLGEIVEISIAPYTSKEDGENLIGDEKDRVVKLPDGSFAKGGGGGGGGGGDIGQKPAVCALSSARWSSTNVSEGQTVFLIAEGNSACDGRDVMFVIGSESALFNSVENSPANTVFSDGHAISSWSSEYQINVLYYFNASVENSNIYVESGRGLNELLNVSQIVFNEEAIESCADGDAQNSESLEQQSATESFAVYSYSTCGELGDLGNGECSFTLTANDVCKNSGILYEQTCSNNKLQIAEFNCVNGCSAGKCL